MREPCWPGETLATAHDKGRPDRRFDSGDWLRLKRLGPDLWSVAFYAERMTGLGPGCWAGHEGSHAECAALYDEVLADPGRFVEQGRTDLERHRRRQDEAMTVALYLKGSWLPCEACRGFHCEGLTQDDRQRLLAGYDVEVPCPTKGRGLIKGRELT